MRIGVFDSGIGGLTILKSIINKYPNNEYIYFGDNYNLPYGEKTKDELYILADNIIKFLISNKVDILVMACGTLSSNIYDSIKNKYGKPIFDIINPTANYLKNSSIKSVLLLATPMTIKSGIFKKKLEEVGIKVYDVACPKFVPIIEDKLNEDINIYIEEYLKDYKKLDIGAIIPGCTHYPIVEKEITNYIDKPFINIGDILTETLEIKDSKNDVVLYFSQIDDDLIDNVNKIFPGYKLNKKRL